MATESTGTPIRRLQVITVSLAGVVTLVFFLISLLTSGTTSDITSTIATVAAIVCAVIGVSFALVGGRR